MAKLRVMKKEATILMERNGHALFIWMRRSAGDDPEEVKTFCARCGEEFTILHSRRCYISGPINRPCAIAAKGDAR